MHEIQGEIFKTQVMSHFSLRRRVPCVSVFKFSDKKRQRRKRRSDAGKND